MYISAAVIWEAIIKKSLGKLTIPGDLEEVLAANGFEALPITAAHALLVETLPLLHRDPFDRMLIAQSLAEGLTLVTRDPAIMTYPVSLLPA